MVNSYVQYPIISLENKTNIGIPDLSVKRLNNILHAGTQESRTSSIGGAGLERLSISSTYTHIIGSSNKKNPPSEIHQQKLS